MISTMRNCPYICFGGCGCKLISYLGFLSALQQKSTWHTEWHAQLIGACGSSSGCLAALAYLVDANAQDVLKRLSSLNVDSVVTNYVNFGAMLATYGVDSGDTVKQMISEFLSACGIAQDTTFRTLYRLTKKDLRVCATNLQRFRLEVFSHEHTPDVIVAHAIYWSMCVPFVFAPETFKGDIMIDGCALAYVPIDIWPLEKTMVFYATGFKTSADEREELEDLKSFASSILKCCAISVLRRIEELSQSHPSHFVHIHISNKEDDVLLRMTPAIFDSLVSTGYSHAIQLLFPDISTITSALIRFGIEHSD